MPKGVEKRKSPGQEEQPEQPWGPRLRPVCAERPCVLWLMAAGASQPPISRAWTHCDRADPTSTGAHCPEHWDSSVEARDRAPVAANLLFCKVGREWCCGLSASMMTYPVGFSLSSWLSWGRIDIFSWYWMFRAHWTVQLPPGSLLFAINFVSTPWPYIMSPAAFSRGPAGSLLFATSTVADTGLSPETLKP